ncbi:MAG: DUF4162 domain-containing protein, partial [Anaerolineales bacterium]|nr:DUF4162 domain-containing protein [Anaerolineales bacterium]
NGRFINSLNQLPAIHRAYGEEGHIVLQVQEANEALPDIIHHLSNAGCHIRRLEIQEPNLEAVFLNLTGRALRD